MLLNFVCTFTFLSKSVKSNQTFTERILFVDCQVYRILPRIYYSENISKEKIIGRNSSHFAFLPLFILRSDTVCFIYKTDMRAHAIDFTSHSRFICLECCSDLLHWHIHHLGQGQIHYGSGPILDIRLPFRILRQCPGRETFNYT